MILIDTHIWIWWVHDHPSLKPAMRDLLAHSEEDGIGVSVISCWEVAKLVERNRLVLPCATEEWLQVALAYPGVRLIELSPRICVGSTQLPGEFHRDPADQIIVATARVLGVTLLTDDEKILVYPHVNCALGTP